MRTWLLSKLGRRSHRDSICPRTPRYPCQSLRRTRMHQPISPSRRHLDFVSAAFRTNHTNFLTVPLDERIIKGSGELDVFSVAVRLRMLVCSRPWKRQHRIWLYFAVLLPRQACCHCDVQLLHGGLVYAYSPPIPTYLNSTIFSTRPRATSYLHRIHLTTCQLILLRPLWAHCHLVGSLK